MDFGQLEPLPSDGTLNDNAEQTGSPSSRASRWGTIGIVLFGVATFFFFLMLKLPEARIQNLVIAHTRIAAQQAGLLFSAEKVRVGILLGPSIKLYNVELKSADNERQSLKIPFLRIRPKLFSLLTQTKKASITAELLDGDISGTVGASAAETVVDLDIDSIDLGATNLLKKFTMVDLAGKVKGRVKLNLNLSQGNKSEGVVDLVIHKLNLPAQAIMGFTLPSVKVEESKIDLTIDQGHLNIKTFEVGHDLKTDDLIMRAAGDGTLEGALERTKLNAKATIEISQRITQALPLLDSIMGMAKGADGKFHYKLTGPVYALEATPGQ
jgi:type II secretion system protein N